MVETGDRAALANAGDAMMLLINPGLWNVLVAQGKAEGAPPGAILAKAMEQYVGTHGSEEVRGMLKRMKP